MYITGYLTNAIVIISAVESSLLLSSLIFYSTFYAIMFSCSSAVCSVLLLY